MELKLFFLSNSNKYSLDKVVFKAANQDPAITSKRGNGSLKDSSFKWSQGVRSLSLFFIEAQKYSFSKPLDQLPLLSGFQGSPAASLDYAISKQPIWMSEMFGSDSRGRPLLLKLIRRENTELKRPGPVDLHLSSIALRELKLELYSDNILLSDNYQLTKLALNLENCSQRKGMSPNYRELNTEQEQDDYSIKHSFLGENTGKIVSNLIRKDLAERLNSIEIFQSSKFSKYLDLVLNKKILIKEGLDPRLLLKQIHANNNFNNLLGIVTREDYDYLRENLSSISIKTNIWGSSTNAILKYLQQIKKLPITIDYSEMHSHAIYNNISRSKDISKMPDIILLGLGGVLNLFSKPSEYELLLPSPSSSVTLLSSKAAVEHSKRKLPILVDIKERSTTGLFALEEIQNSNSLIKPSEIKPTGGSYDELFSMSKEGEAFKTLLHYPHNEIAMECNNSKLLYQGTLHSFFLIHRRISENKKLTHILNAIIRDAWLTIREQSRLKKLLVESILSDEEYVKRFERLTGLYQIA